MDESDLTMEAYIELHAEKAQRRGRTFNWETATYGLKRLRKVGSARMIVSFDEASLGVTAGQDMAEKEVSTVDLVTTAGVEVSTASTIPISAVPTTSTTTTIISDVEITLAQALVELKTAKPKVKGIIFKEPVESTTIATTPIPLPKPLQDKGKAKMIQPEKPLKKKDQIMFDEEVPLKL
ncbi:hypothetical protein Tco_0267078 [Tanacetum coccineum]